MSLTKCSNIMFLILLMMYIGPLQADIVTNTFYKVEDCDAVSGAPSYVKEMKSRSRIHCFTQCSKIPECDSIIYQSTTKTCLLYGASEATCPSTNGRSVDVYKKNAAFVTQVSVTTDSSISSTENIVEATSHTEQNNGIQTDVSTLISTQSINMLSTSSYVTTHDPSCVNGKYSSELNGRSVCICNDGFMGTDCLERLTSCTDWANYLFLLNGESRYSRQTVTIQPPNSQQPFSVMCEVTDKVNTYIYMNTEKVSDAWDKTWSDMKKGYNFTGGFWVGLDHLYELINIDWSSNKLSLRISLDSNIEPSLNNFIDKITEFDLELYEVQMGNEMTNYQLQYKYNYIYKYFSLDLNGAMFSAKDKDNDGVDDVNCAREMKRAFWYNGKCSLETISITITQMEIRQYWDGIKGGFKLNDQGTTI